MLADLNELLPRFRESEAVDPEAYPRQSVAALYAAGIPGAPFSSAKGGEGATCRQASHQQQRDRSHGITR